MMFKQSTQGNALAAGTMLIALIDTLIDKGIIARSDAQGILIRAGASLKREDTSMATEALAVVADLMPRYA
jgi:hypothetical protein